VPLTTNFYIDNIAYSVAKQCINMLDVMYKFIKLPSLFTNLLAIQQPLLPFSVRFLISTRCQLNLMNLHSSIYTVAEVYKYIIFVMYVVHYTNLQP